MLVTKIIFKGERMDYYDCIDYDYVLFEIVREDVEKRAIDFNRQFWTVAKHLKASADVDENLLSFKVGENLLYIKKSNSVAEIKDCLTAVKNLVGQIQNRQYLTQRNMKKEMGETKNLLNKLSLLLKLKKEKKIGKVLEELNLSCDEMFACVDPYLKELHA